MNSRVLKNEGWGLGDVWVLDNSSKGYVKLEILKDYDQ